MSTENKFIEKWIVLDEKTNEFKGIGDVEYSALSVGDKQLKFVEIAAVEQLKRDLDKVNNEYYEMKIAYKEKLNDNRDEIQQLKSKLAKAKEALEFYADKNKWNTMYYVKDCFAAIGPDDLTGNHFNINDKSYGGKKARQALSEIGEGK